MKKIFIPVIIAAIIGIVLYAVNSEKTPKVAAPVEEKIPTDTIAPAEMSKTYADEEYKFSFKYPEAFTVNTIPNDMPDQSGKLIVVQNSTGQGFQMSITPTDGEVTVLTPERIHQDLPDLAIHEPQEVIIGDGGKGLAFISDNETFSGGSREVWFVYGGAFYQISTYKRYDPFLQAVLQTWEFK
jgi:hypothetical protein